MNLEQCRYLICIAKNGSINKASEELDISHQALSKMVKKLEQELSCEIFKRNEQGVVPTTDGEKILTFAQLFIEEGSLIKFALEQCRADSEKKAALKILTTMVPQYSFLPEVVEFLMRSYPMLNVEMHHKNREAIDRELLQNNHESVLAFLTKREQSSVKLKREVKEFKLCRDKTYLVTGKNFPLTTQRWVEMEELKGKKFAIYQYDNSFDMVIFQRLQQADIPFEVVMKTDNLKVWENSLKTSETIGLSTKLLRAYHYFHLDESQLNFYEIENYPEADIVMLAKNIADQDMLDQLLTMLKKDF